MTKNLFKITKSLCKRFMYQSNKKIHKKSNNNNNWVKAITVRVARKKNLKKGLSNIFLFLSQNRTHLNNNKNPR